MEIKNISLFIVVLPIISGFLGIAQTGIRTIEVEPTPPNTIITSKPATEAYSVQQTEDSIVLPNAKQTYEWDNAEIVRLPLELQKIAKCESGNRHTDEGGEIIKNYNTNGTIDYGRFQINSVHIPRMESLGLNILDEVDNIKFALILYKEQGVKPWYGYNPKHEVCSWSIKT